MQLVRGCPMLEVFGEGLEVLECLEHKVVMTRNMEEDQGLTLEDRLSWPTYISAQYVQGNAVSSGPKERRGSKTYKSPPPS